MSDLLSTNAFNLDQFKILPYSKEFTLSFIYTNFNTLKKKALGKHCGTRCVCETLMPPKHPSFEKHDPDI